MAHDWNPDADQTLGLEFLRAVADRGFSADSGTAGVGLKLTPDAAGTASSAWIVPARGSVGLSSDLPMVLDIWEQGDELSLTPTLTGFQPTAFAYTQDVSDQDGTIPPDITTIQFSGDPIWTQSLYVPGFVDVQFGVAGLGGRQILSVFVEVVASHRTRVLEYPGVGEPAGFLQDFTAPGDEPGRFYAMLGECNRERVTREWARYTPGDVGEYTPGGPRWIRVQSMSGYGGEWQLHMVKLWVLHIAEARQAGGIGASGNALDYGPDRWCGFALETPAGAAGWTYANGQPYAVVLRQPHPASTWTPEPTFRWQAIGAVGDADAPFLPDLTLHEVDLDPVSRMPRAATAFGPALPELPAWVLDEAPQTTTQPYSVHRPATVYGGFTAQQRLTPTGATSYASIIAVVRPSDLRADDQFVSSLVVAVRRNSDNVQIGGLGVISQDDVIDQGIYVGEGFYRVEIKFPAPLALAGGTTYYFSFGSLADEEHAWALGALLYNAGPSGAGMPAHTFGSGVDTGAGITEFGIFTTAALGGTIQAALAETVEAPTELTATLGTVEMPPPPAPVANRCQPSGYDYASLAWAPTAIGADFSHYEIQRMDEWAETEWITVIRIYDEDVITWADHLPRIGVPSHYRIRAVRATDGASSTWATHTEWIVPAARGCELVFSSNVRPELAVAYGDVYDARAAREYDFLSANDVEFIPLYGRFGQVAQMPDEDRGIRFRRTLLVAALAAPIRPGLAAFDALRTLANPRWRDLNAERIPYVGVRDNDGNRWYGTLVVRSATVRQPAHLHLAQVEFTETISAADAGRA
jgi:hypothetical protein